MKKLLLSFLLALSVSPAWSQNPMCPTRPFGDNTNACSSTAFVQTAINNIPLPHTHIFVGNGAGLARDYGALATFGDDGTFTITPTVNTTTQGLEIVHAVSGGPHDNALHQLNQIFAVDNGDYSVGGGLIYFEVFTGQNVGIKGSRTAILGSVGLNGQAADTGFQAAYQGVIGQATIATNGNNADAAPAAQMFGSNFIAAATAGASNILAMVAGEDDVLTACAACVSYQAVRSFIYQIGHISQGSYFDGMVSLSAGWDSINTLSAANRGGKYAFAVGNQNGQWPLATTATLLGIVDAAAGKHGPYTIAKGIDFTNLTFTGNQYTGTGASIGLNGAFSSGLAGTATGQLSLVGTTSGTAVIKPQDAAGTPLITLGTNNGTPAVSASLPLFITSATGNITCATCATATLNTAALTKVDDTNVTLTLGGLPASALLNAASITVGWTGTLAVGRGGTGQSTLTANAFLTGNTTSGINQVAITGLVLGAGASAPAAYGGTSCTNQFIRSLNASGAATCASVANTDLTNSSVTYGSTTVALGATSTSIAGLVSIATAIVGPTANGTAAVKFTKADLATQVLAIDTTNSTLIGANGVGAGFSLINASAVAFPALITSTNYVGLNDTSGSPGAQGVPVFFGGNATDPTNYYSNTTHTYRSRNLGTNFAITDATKIAALQTTVSTSKTTGAITSAGGIGIAGATFTDTLNIITAANAAGDNLLCWTAATGLVTRATTVIGCVPSAMRLKNVQGIFDNAHVLDKIAMLDIGKYTYKSELNLGNTTMFGLYAEQMCKIDALLCHRDEQGEIDNYDKIGALAVAYAAIQQLKIEIDQLKLSRRKAND